MACEICGKNNCTAGFHSIEEQQSFNEIADKIKDRAKEYIVYRINRLDNHYCDEDNYVKLEEVIEIIEDYS